MSNLIKLQFARTIKQKPLWIYLAAMFLMIISKCLSLQDPTNAFYLIYSGSKFPISTLHDQAIIVGPLFFALIAAFSVNGEKASGVFKQPLLNGITKIQLLNCKMLNIISVMILSIVLMEFLSFIIGFFAWGNTVFDELLSCILHIGLTIVPLTVSCIGFILLTLYTPNTAVTMCVVFLILLIDNLVSQFFDPIVSKFSYMYYVYAYCGFNAKPIETWMIPKGLVISLITGITFYLLACRRIRTMQF